MQWDVAHIIGFIVEAIVDEHRGVEVGDFLITLHMPNDVSEAKKIENRNIFAEKPANRESME
eukprot:9510877-Prorocentrum_lima.AAC.1